MGKPDLAKEKYEQVLQEDPQNEPAKAGILRVKGMMGVAPDEQGERRSADEAIAAELKKPKDQQDWTKVDEMIQQLAKDRKLDPTIAKLYQAQVMMMREDYDGAAKVLAEAKTCRPRICRFSG